MQDCGLRGTLLPSCAACQYNKLMVPADSGKYNPQKYLAKRRNDPELRQKALADAEKIASFLSRCCDAKVYGIGSLFEPDREFSRKSDIDLVARGIPAGEYFRITAEAAFLTNFHLDIIPYENANDLIRETVKERGILL